MQVTCLILLLLAPSWLVTISSDSSLKVAEVQKREEVRQITVAKLKTLLEKKQPVTILDVRMDHPYAASQTKIKGAKRIQPDDIEAQLKEIPRDKEIVTYCT